MAGVFSTTFLNLVICWQDVNCSAFFLKFLLSELPDYLRISNANRETFSSLQGSTEMTKNDLTSPPTLQKKKKRHTERILNVIYNVSFILINHQNTSGLIVPEYLFRNVADSFHALLSGLLYWEGKKKSYCLVSQFSSLFKITSIWC